MLYKYFFGIVISFWSASIPGVLGSDHATNFNNASSNATIPASIVSLGSDASVPVSTAGGAIASAEAAPNSALSVATAAAASYVSVLPTKNLFGTTDPTGTPDEQRSDEQRSDATRRMTASMMGVGMMLVVALVL